MLEFAIQIIFSALGSIMKRKKAFFCEERSGQEKGKLARNNNKSGPENNNLATTEWEMQEKELSIFNFIFLS